MNARRVSLSLAAVAILVACTSPESSDPAADAGEPRTVAVTMSDDLSFDPAELTVRRGETVAFEVTNEGATVHEFLIGDEEQQAEYAEQMASGEMHHGTEAGVSVEPGETATFEYTFDTEQPELLAGCHEPGHYDAGMVAIITVDD